MTVYKAKFEQMVSDRRGVLDKKTCQQVAKANVKGLTEASIYSLQFCTGQVSLSIERYRSGARTYVGRQLLG